MNASSNPNSSGASNDIPVHGVDNYGATVMTNNSPLASRAEAGLLSEGGHNLALENDSSHGSSYISGNFTIARNRVSPTDDDAAAAQDAEQPSTSSANLNSDHRSPKKKR